MNNEIQKIAEVRHCEHCEHYQGYCNECYYYDTWNGRGWCKKESHVIEVENIEKGCYVSR